MVTTTTFFFSTKYVRDGIISWGYNLFDVLREMGVTEQSNVTALDGSETGLRDFHDNQTRSN